MSSQSKHDSPQTYSSLDALREAHIDLLGRYGDDSAILEEPEPVLAFICDGRTAGRCLQLYPDRKAAQGILDYWANACRMAGCAPPKATLDDFDASRYSSEDLQMSRRLRSAAEDWKRLDRSKGALWNEELVKKAQHLASSPLETEFLAESRHHARNRRILIILAVAAGMCLAAVVTWAAVPAHVFAARAERMVQDLRVETDPVDRAGLYDSAIWHYNEAIRRDPEFATAYYGRALVGFSLLALSNRGGSQAVEKTEPVTLPLDALPRFEDIVRDADKALRLDQELCGDANCLLGSVHGFQGKPMVAAGKLADARECGCNSARFQLELGDQNLESFEGAKGAQATIYLDDAERSYLDAVRQAVDRSGTLPECGEFLEPPVCIAGVQEAHCVDSEVLRTASLGLAEVYGRMEQPTRAESCSRLAAAIDPDDTATSAPFDKPVLSSLQIYTDCIAPESQQ